MRRSWLREVMPGTWPRWYCTVRGDRNSRAPISGFDSPSRASRGDLRLQHAVGGTQLAAQS